MDGDHEDRLALASSGLGLILAEEEMEVAFLA
jgi:hypothetical protein